MNKQKRAALTQWIENREALRHIRGRPSDGKESEDEGGHFYACKHCRQPVDMRSLYQVLHHEQAEHDPLPVNG